MPSAKTPVIPSEMACHQLRPGDPFRDEPLVVIRQTLSDIVVLVMHTTVSEYDAAHTLHTTMQEKAGLHSNPAQQTLHTRRAL